MPLTPAMSRLPSPILLTNLVNAQLFARDDWVSYLQSLDSLDTLSRVEALDQLINDPLYVARDGTVLPSCDLMVAANLPDYDAPLSLALPAESALHSRYRDGRCASRCACPSSDYALYDGCAFRIADSRFDDVDVFPVFDPFPAYVLSNPVHFTQILSIPTN